jgi:hypothetical protein
MNRTPDESLAELEAAWLDFIVRIWMREGLVDSAHERLRAALIECAALWAEWDSIPRRAAGFLVDVCLVTEGCATPYPEAERRRIVEAAYYLQELVHRCVDWPAHQSSHLRNQL